MKNEKIEKIKTSLTPERRQKKEKTLARFKEIRLKCESYTTTNDELKKMFLQGLDKDIKRLEKDLEC